MAFSTESTILIDKIKSLYSVVQSSWVAGIKLIIWQAFSSPLTLTFLAVKASTILGKYWSAIFSWINKVSMALQAAGYWVLLSTVMLIALSKSACSSMYKWQIPSAWPKTGIFVFSWTYLTKEFEPLGIIKSTYWSNFKSSLISSLVVKSFTTSGLTLVVAKAWWMILTKVWQEFKASFPPFKITPLLDFIAKLVIWIKASGRASKITPNTPKGQVILFRIKSWSNSRWMEIWPTGSANFLTSLTPLIALFNLFSPNCKRADKAEEIWSFCACSQSILLALIISSL